MVIHTIRKARTNDLETLDVLYSTNMRELVERFYKWDPELFRNIFEANSIDIIEIFGTVAGFTKLVEKRDEFYLAEVQLGKQFRNRGIGTKLIKAAMHKAMQRRKILTLKVIRGNTAEFLYRRLGFIVYEETTMHLKMSWRPD